MVESNALIENLNSTDVQTVQAAASHLVTMGSSIVPALIDNLSTPNIRALTNSMEILGQIRDERAITLHN